MNNNTSKQNGTPEALGEFDERLREKLPKEAGEIMLDQLYDKMAQTGQEQIQIRPAVLIGPILPAN
jgi:hypothetical protein